MNIIILDDHQDAVRKLDCASRLEGANLKVFTNSVKGIAQLAIRLRDADIVLALRERTEFPGPLLERLPRLKLIAQVGPVGGHIDLAAATRLGIAVAASPEQPVAVAEYTWALMLAAMRRLPQYTGHLKHGVWQQPGMKTASMPANFGLGSRLEGKRLGLWGYGEVGRRVARYGQAFGMQVMVWGSESARARALADGLAACPDRDTLFTTSDVLSLHLQLRESTRNLIGPEDLARMHPHALLVNTSAAELIQDGALVSALNRGRPGLAAVDVFESEPILQGHPLLRLENAVCSPHVAFVERESYEASVGATFDNILAFLQRAPTNIVNPDALKVLRNA